MQVKDLSDVFVASGVEMVDDVTFTALFYGYEVRGKVRVPTSPSVEFFLYGNVYIDSKEQAQDFINEFEEKFGHARIKFTDKYISVLLEIGGLEAAQVKERLGAVGSYMISNGFGAIAMPPEEPEPEPEPEKKPEPPKQTQQNQTQKPPQQRQPLMQHMPQYQQQRQGNQTQKPQQPVYEEPKVPFEEYKVLEKLTQIFVNGVNQTSHNMFTTLHHGYNLAGKMLSPVKEDVEIIYYGQLMNNVTEEFEVFKAEMNEKYGNVPMRMIGGSCDVILYLEGKDAAQSKEILGCISGFMMRNNIAAANLPNTVGRTITTFTAESFQKSNRANGPRSLGGYSAQQGSTPSQPGRTYPSGQSGQPRPSSEDNNSFASKFLKKIQKKP